ALLVTRKLRLYCVFVRGARASRSCVMRFVITAPPPPRRSKSPAITLPRTHELSNVRTKKLKVSVLTRPRRRRGGTTRTGWARRSEPSSCRASSISQWLALNAPPDAVHVSRASLMHLRYYQPEFEEGMNAGRFHIAPIFQGFNLRVTAE